MNRFLPSSADPEALRRSRLLVVLLLSFLVSNVGFVVAELFVPNVRTLLPLSAGFLSVIVVLLGLLRLGYVRTASTLTILTLIVVRAAASSLPVLATIAGLGTALEMASAIIIVLAAFLLAWWSTIPTALAIIAVNSVVALLQPEVAPAGFVAAMTLLTFCAVASLFARSLEAALHQARAQQSAAKASAEHIASLNTELQATLDATQSSLERERHLRDTVNKLAVPVQQIGDGVLLVPLIGHIDEARGQQITDMVLQQIHTLRTHALVLDVQGISMIDTSVAQLLDHLIRAIQLLGSTVVLTGVSAEMAATITRLGITFRHVALQPTVSAALHALPTQRLGGVRVPSVA